MSIRLPSKLLGYHKALVPAWNVVNIKAANQRNKQNKCQSRLLGRGPETGQEDGPRWLFHEERSGPLRWMP